MKRTVAPTVFCVLLLVGFCSSVVAQNKYWRDLKGKPLVKFDWNCAAPATLPKQELNRLIEGALRDENTGTQFYADRAFAYDLNGDRRPEYFVPLACGATGNCTFGLFTLNPKRFVGKINGEYLYLHARKGGWPNLISYGRFNVVEGDLITYTFKRGKYAAVGKYVHTDSRGGIYGQKAPAFLERAREGCKALGE